MHKSPIESLHSDREVIAEIRDQWHTRHVLPRSTEIPEDGMSVTEYLQPPLVPVESPYQTKEIITEAIILAHGRPSLLVQKGEIKLPETETWKNRLKPFQAKIEQRIIASVGRVELLGHPDFEWVGTAWAIADGVLVTNRHVAEAFAERQGRQFAFRRNFSGQPVGVRIDFREEYQRSEVHELEVEQILFVAESGHRHPDIAFLKLKNNNRLPSPLELADRDPKVETMIGILGYPARDSRSDGPEMARIFKDIFDVKRFAPGYVSYADDSAIFEHDCSTLGGNSGSVVISLETGQAVGLHFAGRFRVANYAVKASVVRKALAQLGPLMVGGLGGEEVTPKPEDYRDRQGYQEEFLGSSPDLYVKLPDLSPEQQHEAVRVTSARGIGAYVLDYTHFSVVMNQSRKLAYYTAVNIDGNQEVVVRRRNTQWKIDPRIPREHQAGNELYQQNLLDRGHLVRRLDPVWGSEAEARQADDDTFHYTNAAPQHADFNQKSWLELEDYLLDNTNNRDLKISVFTGPIFKDSDISYRDIKIPEEFWKVVVMVDRLGSLHATAYLLSQRRFLDNLEFAFRQFRTYQVPIVQIERETGLSFGRLADFDPFGKTEGFDYQPINTPADLRL